MNRKWGSTIKLQGPPSVTTSFNRIPLLKNRQFLPDKVACWDQVFKARSLWETLDTGANGRHFTLKPWQVVKKALFCRSLQLFLRAAGTDRFL